MFDIGFQEILIVGIVALLVIGPERLPETVRNVAMWLGRLRRSYSNFRRDLEREIGADEIRRDLYNEAIMEDLKRTGDDLKKMGADLHGTIHSPANPSQPEIPQAPQQKPQQMPAPQTDAEPGSTPLSDEQAAQPKRDYD